MSNFKTLIEDEYTKESEAMLAEGRLTKFRQDWLENKKVSDAKKNGTLDVLAKDSSLNISVLNKLKDVALENNDSKLLKTVLSHPKVNDAILNDVAGKSKDEGILEHIASHPISYKDTIKKVSQSAYIASKTLQSLAETHDIPEIHASIVGNPKATDKTLHHIAANPKTSAKLLTSIVKHPNASDRSMFMAVTHNNKTPGIIEHVIKHPSVSAYTLRYIHDQHPEHRDAISKKLGSKMYVKLLK